jgi:GNAT superfamily N-acetyltransferase
LLERAPYENVFLQWLIESGRRGPGGKIVVAIDADGNTVGVGYDGPQIVFTGNEAAVDAFARAFAHDGATRRMIVAPRPLVERFWRRARRHFLRPMAVRASQPLYALEPGWLRREIEPIGDVGRATLADADEIITHAKRMEVRELGGDPNRIEPIFRERGEAAIRAGTMWRCRVEGRLVFQCHAGPVTAATVQLQGVWTPPEERGKGQATRALAAICVRLLAEHRTLSLYVNDFNDRAIALYERVGFRRVGEFASILF